MTPGKRLGVESSRVQEPRVLSTLPDVAVANRAVLSPDAGTLVVRAADLHVRAAGTVPAGAAVPTSGELAVFCRPVVMAAAVARRDSGMLAGGWLPDFVRLGELERHLGDGVIEAIAGAALEKAG
jgi:hypothetical protein